MSWLQALHGNEAKAVVLSYPNPSAGYQTPSCVSTACVGFMADSGMFAMVSGHGISAFPNTILIKTVSSGGESS